MTQPAYSSVPAAGYVPSYTLNPDPYLAPQDNLTWKLRVANALLTNVVNATSMTGLGKPGFWDDARDGSWDNLVQRNFGKGSAMGGDIMAVMSSLSHYQTGSSPWVDTNFPYIAPTGKEYVLDPAYEAGILANDKMKQDMALTGQMFEFQQYQFETEIALRQAENAANNEYRNKALGVQSQGQQLQHSAAMAANAIQEAKIAMDWAIAQLSADTQLTMQERDLAFKKIVHDADTAYRNATLEIQRDQQRLQEEAFAYQKEKDARAEALERAKVMVQLASQPGDAVARQYMLRPGENAGVNTAPQGELVDIFTGQTQGPGTIETSMANNAQLLQPYVQAAWGGAGSQAVGGVQPPPAAPPPTAPPPPPAAPPPAQPPPTMAEGGFTLAKRFWVGDHPENIPNPELVEILTDKPVKTRITPMSQLLAMAGAK